MKWGEASGPKLSTMNSLNDELKYLTDCDARESELRRLNAELVSLFKSGEEGGINERGSNSCFSGEVELG